MYRYLSSETKAQLYKNYIKLKELYSKLTRDIVETIKSMDEDTVINNPGLILKIMRSYAEASIYMDKMDELIIATFMEPSFS